MFILLFFLIGFGFAVSGGVSMIIYLNVIPAGLSFQDYMQLPQAKGALIFFMLGIITMGFSLNKLTRIFVK
ncbi:hypothetical protein [Saliterribacillus persicus]|uniref:Uncharacterized protein n=1 Tax=Saliterribacillus persicus TaxID=930114 RepID=A0A368XQB4_9BACI|nr:hypothetical protein [Saliterribacillus persicus]RCW69729.1 hypothetical protein DFR57_107117 [Saliterribacillus persicus]